MTRLHLSASMVLLLGSLSLLSACGFHLAGTRPLPEPLQRVYINVIAPYQVVQPPLETALRAILQRRGADVRGETAPGTAVIRLSELEETREVLSVGIDGKALEFRLVTSVQYQVFRDGRMLAGPDSLRLTRDYSFQPEQVLAKEAEEARLRAFIQTEMAELMLLRLESQLGKLAAVSTPAPASAP
ncbi:LPS assembly lipoprotein LptE [Sinimarinibacterium flocculans]|uniref:LPS-assembly lipoprotein LptE n=1 Tax=Sinimarinibacterium flocculans TaxID=985250 RepID=A0A318E8Q3_9GAMM|nr:LPS assembly lipoprotein LptE [Sinimarinibacterium flocculans]PXV67033.1 LPS-assembly lipoprotein [Sinimarinibacterium flocculans]